MSKTYFFAKYGRITVFQTKVSQLEMQRLFTQAFFLFVPFRLVEPISIVFFLFCNNQQKVAKQEKYLHKNRFIFNRECFVLYTVQHLIQLHFTKIVLKDFLDIFCDLICTLIFENSKKTFYNVQFPKPRKRKRSVILVRSPCELYFFNDVTNLTTPGGFFLSFAIG